MKEKRRSIPGNLSSFVHFTLEVVFIALFLKIDTWEMGMIQQQNRGKKAEFSKEKVSEWGTECLSKKRDWWRGRKEGREGNRNVDEAERENKGVAGWN